MNNNIKPLPILIDKISLKPSNNKRKYKSTYNKLKIKLYKLFLIPDDPN